MPLTAPQLDRAVGAVLASAAGDALGSQYEFGPALDDAVTPVFGVGQFGHGVGEWTDDTSMAVPILDVLARGDRLEDAASREEIVGRWIGWAQTAKDVGAQTRAVLARIPQPFTEADVLAASRDEHDRAGRSGGNGALMRTGPLALGYLDRSATELAAAVEAISKLTHGHRRRDRRVVEWVRVGCFGVARGVGRGVARVAGVFGGGSAGAGETSS